MPRIEQLLTRIPIPSLLPTGMATQGDYRELQDRSLTKTWFYWALPLSVLTRSVKSWLDGLQRGLNGATSDTAELEIKTIHEGGDWIGDGDNINLHYTARGALLMALFVYSGLGRGTKRLFANESLVLCRFKLPL